MEARRTGRADGRTDRTRSSRMRYSRLQPIVGRDRAAVSTATSRHYSICSAGAKYALPLMGRGGQTHVWGELREEPRLKFHPKWCPCKYINSQSRPADYRNPAPASQYLPGRMRRGHTPAEMYTVRRYRLDPLFCRTSFCNSLDPDWHSQREKGCYYDAQASHHRFYWPGSSFRRFGISECV